MVSKLFYTYVPPHIDYLLLYQRYFNDIYWLFLINHYAENIVAQLMSDHRTALDQSQSHIKLQSLDNDKLRIHIVQQEWVLQTQTEEYLKETTMTYKIASEGLTRASERLQLEIEKNENIELQLAHANKRQHALRNTLVNCLTLQSELDSAEETLYQQDIALEKCDMIHDRLLSCQNDLDSNIPGPGLHFDIILQHGLDQHDRIAWLEKENTKLRDIQDKREYWEKNAEKILDTITFR